MCSVLYTYILSFHPLSHAPWEVSLCLFYRWGSEKIKLSKSPFLCDTVGQTQFCLILKPRLFLVFLLEMDQDIHEMSAHKIGMSVSSGLIPVLLRWTTPSVFFYHMFWVPLSDSEPQAALKSDPTQWGIFHSLLFFSPAVYIKCNINPVYPGSSSKRKHITLHAWGKEDRGIPCETNLGCEAALFCHEGLCHTALWMNQQPNHWTEEWF